MRVSSASASAELSPPVSPEKNTQLSQTEFGRSGRTRRTFNGVEICIFINYRPPVSPFATFL